MAEVKAMAVALMKSDMLWTYLGISVHKIPTSIRCVVSGKGSSPGKPNALTCIATLEGWLVHEMTDSTEAHLSGEVMNIEQLPLLG